MPYGKKGTNKSEKVRVNATTPKNEVTRTCYRVLEQPGYSEFKELKDAQSWIHESGDKKLSHHIQQINYNGKSKNIEMSRIYCAECGSIGDDPYAFDGPPCCDHAQSSIGYVERWKGDETDQTWYRNTERWIENREYRQKMSQPWTLHDTPMK